MSAFATRKAYPYKRQALENTRQAITAHAEETCSGERCPIHKRSHHRMRSWPQQWRDDVQLMERTCPHGVGHPDPDDPKSADSIHGCDGCCKL